MSAVRLFTALLLMFSTAASAELVVDFEDLVLEPETAVFGDATQAPFVSNLVSFNRSCSVSGDQCFPGAWAYSNQTDLTTGGFTNSYSAYSQPDGGGVHESNNFAIASNFSLGESVATLPVATEVRGMYVTNNTYAYLAVADGNDGQALGDPPQFVKGPFDAGDWFKLDIVGRDGSGSETGRVPFYLADFRNGASSIVDDWTWVDLTELGGNVSSLAFKMSSTDNSMFGMNTPAYFAIDDLTLTGLAGDFNNDFAYTCNDVDALVNALAGGSSDLRFDVNDDTLVDRNDLTAWLDIAGPTNHGTSFVAGDANLDGNVDGDDLAIWSEHKFSSTAAWCSGDFDASGAVDGHDFLIWNQNKSTPLTVPESGNSLLLIVGYLVLHLQRRTLLTSSNG